MARDGEVKQMQHFYHHLDPICHPKSGYVTTKRPERPHVDATIMRSFQTELFSSFLPSTYADHANLAAAKHCQFLPNWKKAALLNSYFSCLKVRFCLSIVSYIMMLLKSGAALDIY